MSLLYSLKRAFNIGEDTDDDDEAAISPADATAPQIPEADSAPVTPLPEEPEAAEALAASMLDAVVKLFNTTQPEFVRACLNTDEQCRYLLGAIGADVRQAMEQAVEQARRRGMEQFSAERSRLTDELTTLRSEKEALERRREEYKSEHLSAERQKRALTDRVRDLEQLTATLEAEREQYMLENRSMLNKLRVAGVLGHTLPDDDTPPAPDPALTAELEQKTAELDRLTDELTKLKADLERLTAERDKLTAESEKLRAESEASQSELVESRERIATLEAFLAKGKERSKMLSRELEESRTAEQALREENTRLHRSLDNSQPPADGITLTSIPDHLPAREAPAKDKNNYPEPEAETTAPAEPATPVQKRRRGRKPKKQPRISAIDELMDSTDWLQSPTPEPEPQADKPPDDFGYRPPAKNPADDDQRQLSLW